MKVMNTISNSFSLLLVVGAILLISFSLSIAKPSFSVRWNDWFQHKLHKLDNSSAEEDSDVELNEASLNLDPIKKDNNALWERVRENYAITKNSKHHIDKKRVQSFLGRFTSEEHFIQMTKASPYLYYIVEQLEKRNMPGELALLPMIESAFEPKATSHKGAAGIWQFIPGTGRSFGLKQDKYYDGRRDITASTKAALDYLELLYNQFDKNWMLALAAYNAGEGRVQRAIKQNQKNGISTSFWALKLPKETKDYVPKLLALAEVVAHPDKHDVDLPHIANKPYFTPVNPGKPLDFNKVAKLAGIPVKEVQRLNPGYRKASTHPSGPQQLLLPTANAEKLLSKLGLKADKTKSS